MFGQGFMRPGRGAFKVVVIGIEVDKVDGQFTAHDQLFEVSVFRSFRRVSFLDGQGNGVRAEMSEMKIGREQTGGMKFWMVAVVFIAREMAV